MDCYENHAFEGEPSFPDDSVLVHSGKFCSEEHTSNSPETNISASIHVDIISTSSSDLTSTTEFTQSPDCPSQSSKPYLVKFIRLLLPRSYSPKLSNNATSYSTKKENVAPVNLPVDPPSRLTNDGYSNEAFLVDEEQHVIPDSIITEQRVELTVWNSLSKHIEDAAYYSNMAFESHER